MTYFDEEKQGDADSENQSPTEATEEKGSEEATEEKPAEGESKEQAKFWFVAREKFFSCLPCRSICEGRPKAHKTPAKRGFYDGEIYVIIYCNADIVSATSPALWADPPKCLACGELSAGNGRISMYYTYVLFCVDKERGRKKFYIGVTSDLKSRLFNHKNKKVKTTKSYNKIQLVYYEACLDKMDARKRELQLKTGFGRGYLKKRINSFLKNNAGLV